MENPKSKGKSEWIEEMNNRQIRNLTTEGRWSSVGFKGRKGGSLTELEAIKKMAKRRKRNNVGKDECVSQADGLHA